MFHDTNRNPCFHIFAMKNISHFAFTIFYKPINLPVTLDGDIIAIYRIIKHANISKDYSYYPPEHILLSFPQHGLK